MYVLLALGLLPGFSLDQLVKNDGSHALIATYDKGSIGFFSKARPPKLTINPEGLAIADEIVATFIYVAQKRERQRRRRRQNNIM